MRPKTTPEGTMKKSKGYRRKDKEKFAVAEEKQKETPISVEFPPELLVEIQERAKENRPSKRGMPLTELSQPEKAAKAIWLRAQGVSYRKIQEMLDMKADTVRAVTWRNEDTVETKRKEFAKRYAQVAEQFTDILFEKADRLLDDPDKLDQVDPSKLALTVGIMTDKAAQLSGMATVTIEHRKGVTVEDAAKAIEEARKRIAENARARSIEAEIVED